MAQTILVKEVCEMLGGYEMPTGFGQKHEVIDKAVNKIFAFDYPIYDEAYRNVLNKKILNRFYMEDIGQETIGLWQHYLEITLNDIMPYYNQLYESELLKFNPLYDVDVTTDYKKDFDGQSDGLTSLDRNKDNTNTTTHNVTVDSTDNFTRDLKTSDKKISDSNDTITDDLTRNLSTIESTSKDNTGTQKEDYNRNLESVSETLGSTTADSTTDTKKDDWNLFLDTPQGGLQALYGIGGLDAEGNPLPGSGKYLDEARHQYGEENVIAHTEGSSESGTTLTETGTTGNVRTDNLKELGTSDILEGGTSTNTRTNLLHNETTGTVDQTGTSSNVKKDLTTGTVGDLGNEKEITSGSSNTVIDNTEMYVERVVGKRGGFTYAKMLEDYRRTLLNIDKMILDELKGLFYGLYT